MIYCSRRTLNCLFSKTIQMNEFKRLFTTTLNEETKLSRHEDFSSPIWRKSILFGFFLYAVYKMDQWYASHHEGKGPFTRIIEYYIIDEEECKRRNVKYLNALSKSVEERMNYRDTKRPMIYRLKFPEQLNQGSAYNIIAGTDIDVSQFKVKSDADFFDTNK